MICCLTPRSIHSKHELNESCLLFLCLLQTMWQQPSYKFTACHTGYNEILVSDGTIWSLMHVRLCNAWWILVLQQSWCRQNAASTCHPSALWDFVPKFLSLSEFCCKLSLVARVLRRLHHDSFMDVNFSPRQPKLQSTRAFKCYWFPNWSNKKTASELKFFK